MNEFVNAEKGSIQEEFWNMYKDNYINVDYQENMEGMANEDTMKKSFDGKLIGFLSSLYSHAVVKQGCKLKVSCKRT